MKFLAILILFACTTTFAAIPRFIRSISEDKWNLAAKILQNDPSKQSVNVSQFYDSEGIVKWEFILVRFDDHFEEITFCYWDLVRRVEHRE